MRKVLLLCDLDNTLIHSYKSATSTDICVGEMDGREQDFMSAEAYSMLCELPENIQLVPITTRSEKQYKRIKWPEERTPKYAAVACGAKLLIHDTVALTWNTYVKRLLDPYKNELERLQTEFGFVVVDDSYAFSKSQWVPPTLLPMYSDGSCVTALPPGIDKGAVARFLKSTLCYNVVLSAGDSVLDVSMLNEADVAIVPNTKLPVKVKKHVNDSLYDFASFVLKTAKQYL